MQTRAGRCRAQRGSRGAEQHQLTEGLLTPWVGLLMGLVLPAEDYCTARGTHRAHQGAAKHPLA